LFSHRTSGLTDDSLSAVTAVTANSDMAITAVFKKDVTPRNAYGTLKDARDGKVYKTIAPKTYALTLSAGLGGKVSRNPNKASYNAGEIVFISAVPDSGYEFFKWTGGKTANAVSAVTAVAVNSDMAVAARFRAKLNVVYGTLTDARDGQKYKTAKVGGKIWMTRNLNYQRKDTTSLCGGKNADDCSKNTRLKEIKRSLDNFKDKKGGFRCYGDDTSNCSEYGRLYEWNAAMSVCPAGWRLPTDREWRNLFEIAGGVAVAGKKLKSANGWDKNGNGDAAFEFSAPPGGRFSAERYQNMGAAGYWWTATETKSFNNAHYRSFNYDQDIAEEGYGNKGDGLSVRCVTDAVESAGVKRTGGADFTDAVSGMEMVFVSGGTFTMGCTDEQKQCATAAKPAHSVTVGDFYISRHEVTQKQWRSVMDALPVNLSWSSDIKGDNLPVYYVDLDDVRKFIQDLNRKTGQAYRLPTEAEWEYAARGGAKSKGYNYSGGDNIDDVAWYNANSGDKPLNEDSLEEYTKKHGADAYQKKLNSNNNKARAVGGKKPNELGLYDMSGNLWEWCGDWFAPYDSVAQKNPAGPERGSEGVARGGCWCADSWGARVSTRLQTSPRNSRSAVGFRLVLPVP